MFSYLQQDSSITAENTSKDKENALINNQQTGCSSDCRTVAAAATAASHTSKTTALSSWHKNSKLPCYLNLPMGCWQPPPPPGTVQLLTLFLRYRSHFEAQ
jgi:hypothetical protein